jgi:hypothetical protein
MIRKFPNDSAFFYRAGYCVNADGARHAYHRDNTGLDYLQNAGSPGNWWGIACDANGDPYISPTGYYVSTTSLCDSRFPESSPERYVDSETVPFYVLPGGKHFGAVLGDYAYVYNTSNGRGAGAIFADGGPADKIGEGSIHLAQLLNIPSNPKNGGCEDGIIWVVFPGSKDEKIFPIDLNQLQARASRLFASWGGLGRLAEVYPQLIKPTQHKSQFISDVANLKPMPVLSLEDLAKEAESSIGTLLIGHRTCLKEKPLSSDTPGLRVAWIDPGETEYEIVKRLPDEKGHYHLVLRLPSGKEIDIYIYGLHAVLKIKGDDGNGAQAEEKPVGSAATESTPKFDLSDIDWSDASDRISKYFNVGEATKGDPERTPSKGGEVARNILKMAAELDKLREAYGKPIRVTSWYRPAAINRRVGGASQSQHIHGRGVDICPVDGDIHQFQEWCDEHWYGALGYGAHRGFVHLDNRNGKGFESGGEKGVRWNY